MFQKLKNIYHGFQALIAGVFYGFPSRRLKVLGVTGTDGKTTTTHLIYHILKTSGKRVSMISTVYARVGEREYETGLHTTTPSPFIIQRMLRETVKHGDEYFVLETTSHALDQNRVWGVKYEASVITNITHEHLDYHKTYEDYVRAKARLLKNSKVSFINEEDGSYKLLQIQSPKSKGYNSQVKIIDGVAGLTSFNRQNFAAAYSVCKTLGLTDGEILTAMKTFELPKGRLELVYDGDFKIIIDFAHTPNAFLRLLPEIKKQYLKGKGKLIHIFGAAGERDQSKRGLMGDASGQFSDLVILTEEDYRSEDVMEICNQIAAGLENKGLKKVTYDGLRNSEESVYSIVVNREKAIKVAIQAVRQDDVIVITGKSHEKSLARGSVEYPWSEHEAVKNALRS